jgi:predicted nucleic acid-binding protein
LTIYVDSSFLVSNYIQDVHSAEATRRMGQHPSVWITQLTGSEMANALFRYVFRGNFSLAEVHKYWGEFESDCAMGVWSQTDLPAEIWGISIGLARNFGPTLGVRTLDSLHVACALELHAKKFWTFDERQAKLAEAVGLDTSA